MNSHTAAAKLIQLLSQYSAKICSLLFPSFSLDQPQEGEVPQREVDHGDKPGRQGFESIYLNVKQQENEQPYRSS